MKNSIKKLFTMLAIGMSFVAVQSVSAETYEVEGTITNIIDSTVVIDNETTINGMRLDYLCNQYTICLDKFDTVSVDYYEYECLSGTIKNKATSITGAGEDGTEVTVYLP